MKPHLALSIISLFVFSVNIGLAQTLKNKEVQFLIDTTITIMKANAVNAEKVNWVSIKQDAYKQAENLDSPYEFGGVMRGIFKSIGDFHGQFFQGDSSFRWQGKPLVISDEVKNEWKKSSGIKTGVLENNIGYLRVPGMSQGNGRPDWDRKAQALNDSLSVLLSQHVKGLILDLRIDGGGVMFPMMLGLKNLLGEGNIGSFQTKKSQMWSIKSNKFLIDTSVLAAINPKPSVDARSLPCVLLIGPGTGSSGEFLVMAFKGRSNTTLMGTETAGYVTINNGFFIKDKSSMNLSVGYGRDRKGRNYTQAIQPDIVLNSADNFNNLLDDAKVKAAIKWLKSQK